MPVPAADWNLFLADVSGGGYISIVKTVPVLLVLLAWSWALAWVDKDAPAAHLPRIPINSGMLCGMILGFAIFFALPMFILAFPALLAVLGAEAAIYLSMRKKRVGLEDLQDQFDTWKKGLRKKKEAVRNIPNTVGIVMKNGSIMPPPPEESEDVSAFEAVQVALTPPMQKGAELMELLPAENGIAVRYAVDGVTYKGTTIDRAVGASAISLLKRAVGLDINERRKPQRTMVKLAVDGKRHDFRLDTQGSTAGEALTYLSDPKKQRDFKVETLGLTPKQLQTVKELAKGKQGLILIAAPKGQGMTSAMYAVIKAHDAFIEHIHTVEREPDVDLEGITQNKLPANAAPADEAQKIDWIISQDPDVILATRLDDQKSARDLAKFAENKMAYVGIRAGSTFEALSRWRKLIGDDALALGSLKMVLSGRVLRKLCIACKVGYAPDPGTLRKLAMDPQKVTQLFQARTEPMRDAKGQPVPCDFCKDLRFKGRRGVYEMLMVDDDVREAATSDAAENQLKATFRKQKGRYLQEEALALVEQGETSVQEVLRVLKGADAAPQAAPTPAAAATVGAAPRETGQRVATPPSRSVTKPARPPAG